MDTTLDPRASRQRRVPCIDREALAQVMLATPFGISQRGRRKGVASFLFFSLFSFCFLPVIFLVFHFFFLFSLFSFYFLPPFFFVRFFLFPFSSFFFVFYLFSFHLLPLFVRFLPVIAHFIFRTKRGRHRSRGPLCETPIPLKSYIFEVANRFRRAQRRTFRSAHPLVGCGSSA